MTSTLTKPPAPPNPCKKDSPQWLYCEIMRHIEPDLLPERLALHERMYKWETDDDRFERMRHYDEALALYDRIYADVAAMMTREAHAQKHVARMKVGKQEAQEKAEELRRLEEMIRSRFPSA